MTADVQPGVLGEADESGALRCYRHADRETYMRCGRCDRPICPKCGLQGPVGFRCRDCGRLANDPITTFKPRELAVVLGVAVGAGLIAGYVGLQAGYFGIIVGFFGGGLAAEAINRLIGIKRGPAMVGLMSLGILVGVLAGSSFLGLPFLAAFGGETMEMMVAAWLTLALPSALVTGGAMIFGAWTRLR